MKDGIRKTEADDLKCLVLSTTQTYLPYCHDGVKKPENIYIYFLSLFTSGLSRHHICHWMIIVTKQIHGM